MKMYVTFGQVHTHSVNGKTLDKDCVAVIECEDVSHGRKLIAEYFGRVYCFDYTEESFDFGTLRYYPKGLISIND